MVNHSIHPRRLGAALLASLVLLMGAPPASRADLQKDVLSIEKMASAADAIVIGQVRNKESKFADGVIQTKYTLSVSQTLKGKAASSLEITQPGGVVEGLPFKHVLDGRPTLFKDEKVLLFLANPDPAVKAARQQSAKNREAMRLKMQDEGKEVPRYREIPENHPLKTSMTFVGAWQGRFTIVTDPETGRDVAMQVGPNAGGVDMQSEEALKAFKAQALKSAPAPTASPALAPGGAAKLSLAPAPDEKALDNFLTEISKGNEALPLDIIKDRVRLQLAQDAASK